MAYSTERRRHAGKVPSNFSNASIPRQIFLCECKRMMCVYVIFAYRYDSLHWVVSECCSFTLTFCSSMTECCSEVSSNRSTGCWRRICSARNVLHVIERLSYFACRMWVIYFNHSYRYKLITLCALVLLIFLITFSTLRTYLDNSSWTALPNEFVHFCNLDSNMILLHVRLPSENRTIAILWNLPSLFLEIFHERIGIHLPGADR